MIVIGLTGSIGMGKTTAANMLREMGIPVHCSDIAVGQLYNRKDVIGRIATAFPGSLDGSGEKISRPRLKSILGGDTAKLDKLQDILHPLVREEQQKFLMLQQQAGMKMACLDIPLLFETGAERRVDYTICVTAPDYVQRHRVMSRPGMTEEQFKFMLSRQMPDAEKRARADFVVSTGVGRDFTRSELVRVLGLINERSRGVNLSHDEPQPKKRDKGPKP
jgi:dephospho-CoA kinase